MDAGEDGAPPAIYVVGGVRPMQTVVVPNPAAGTDWSYQFKRPGRLWAAYAKLVTDSTVANRDPNFTFSTADGETLLQVPVQADQTASLTVQWNWFREASLANKSSHQCISIPLLYMGWDYKVGPITSGLDAGDQWQSIALTIEFYE